MSGVDVLADLSWLRDWLSNTTPQGGEAAFETVANVRAAAAELIEDRRLLIAALKEAHYCGLMIGADCAWALAKLQREGVYKPACRDGQKSRADAGRDLEQIKACLVTTKDALARCGAAE